MSFISSTSSSSPSRSPASPKNSGSGNGNGSIKSTMKKSKNIIITGGARGIGRVMARHFLSSPSSQQNHVFLIDVDAAELAYCVGTHLAQHVDAGGLPRVRGFAADMRDPAQIRAAVHDAAAWFPGGRVDVLVNNAGVGPFWSGGRTMEDPATAGEWASVVATNLSGPFLASQAVIPFMKKKMEEQQQQRGGQRDGNHGGDGDHGQNGNGSGSGSGSGSRATTTTTAGGTSSEDDQKTTYEEDTKVDKGEEDADIGAAVNDTIDTITDAIKTTMNLDEKKYSDDSDDDSAAAAIATSTAATTTPPSSSSRGSSDDDNINANTNANHDDDDDDDEAIFAPGPCIIHISSFRAHRSDPNSEAYAATKAGLVGLTHAMAVSAQAWGIRVNALSPGYVSVRHECREGDREAAPANTWAARHAAHEHALFPAGRVGRGEDIAEAVEYLAGAGYISESSFFCLSFFLLFSFSTLLMACVRPGWLVIASSPGERSGYLTRYLPGFDMESCDW